MVKPLIKPGYWEIDQILDEHPSKGYLVDWTGLDDKGHRWTPSWVLKKDATKPAIKEWHDSQEYADYKLSLSSKKAVVKRGKGKGKGKKREIDQVDDTQEDDPEVEVQVEKSKKGRPSKIPKVATAPVVLVDLPLPAPSARKRPAPKDVKNIKVVSRKSANSPASTSKAPTVSVARYHDTVLSPLAHSAVRVQYLRTLASDSKSTQINIPLDDPEKDFTQWRAGELCEVFIDDEEQGEDEFVEEYLQWKLLVWKNQILSPENVGKLLVGLAVGTGEEGGKEDNVAGLKASLQALALIKFLDEEGKKLADLAGTDWYGLGTTKPLKKAKKEFAKKVEDEKLRAELEASVGGLPDLDEIDAYVEAKEE